MNRSVAKGNNMEDKEKMLNIISQEGNAYQNLSEIPAHNYQQGYKETNQPGLFLTLNLMLRFCFWK